MSDIYRVLITSSRDYTNRELVWQTLDGHARTAASLKRPLLVIHGACRTGGDKHADDWARHMRQRGLPVDVERHPAQGHPTEDFGPWPGAGPRRNGHMAGLGAAACEAFIGPCAKASCRKPRPHGSHGATGCAYLAEQAGITVRRWTA